MSRILHSFLLRATGRGALPTAMLMLATPHLTAQAPGTLVVFQIDFTAGTPAQFSGHPTTEPVHGYSWIGPAANQFGGVFLRNDTGGIGIDRVPRRGSTSGVRRRIIG